MSCKFTIFVVILVAFHNITFAQESSKDFSILFYNVENLFDTTNDPQTEDDSFTPEGELHWTNKRLQAKLLNISKAILNSSGWNAPDLLAFCEIENRAVLEKLIRETPLKTIPYKIIHKESPDHRGIDVAFLYNPEQFFPLNYRHFPLKEEDNSEIKTREILYVSGILNGNDTLHIFVNHWPSRYSGVMETRSIRAEAASVLREKVDELNLKYRSPKIVIMGDFNDNPSDESISKILKAKQIQQENKDNQLYNLSFDWQKREHGTLKFQSQWFVFDQIIVSSALLNSKSGWTTKPENARIIEPPFLLEKDGKYNGVKPFRTYFGFAYQGGFSDHLPVILKLEPAN